MSNALKNIKLNEPAFTAQTEKAEKKQIKNAAGGYVFKVDKADRFRRFLTIGTDGGTYYVGESKLTDDNVKFVEKYIAKAGTVAVAEIVNVSTNALAPKNTQALFALALALNAEDLATKSAAKAAVPQVARTATHLFELAQYIENTSGWGRAKTSAFASWYTDKTPDQVAFQAVKYRQRNGWTHRDILRLAHPKGLDKGVADFILGKESEADIPAIINTFKSLQAATTAKQVVKILEANPKATWEMIPTEFLKDADVWRTMFYSGLGQTALLRNTKRMHEIGLMNDMVFAADYAKALSDEELIRKGRLHPIQYLNAYAVIAGDPIGSRYSWGTATAIENANGKIVEALEAGYFKAFKNVTPANKRTMIALDVSGSMASPASGLNISCATLGATFCQLVSKTEPYSIFKGFAGTFKDLNITPNDSLKAVVKKAQDNNFGSTNTALPMEWALKNKVEVDTFIIYTDNDTWGGNQHTHQALNRYREQMGIPSRFICVAATATNYTVSDPSDAGSIDLSGFDASAPKFLADFSAGRI